MKSASVPWKLASNTPSESLTVPCRSSRRSIKRHTGTTKGPRSTCGPTKQLGGRFLRHKKKEGRYQLNRRGRTKRLHRRAQNANRQDSESNVIGHRLSLT